MAGNYDTAFQPQNRTEQAARCALRTHSSHELRSDGADQLADDCHASVDGAQSSRQPHRHLPVRTCSTYNFQGRAPRAGPGLATVHAKAPRDSDADCGAAQSPPVAGWRPGDRGAPGAGCLPLAPSGHVGADAHSPPQPIARAVRRNVSGGARLQTGPSLRRPHPEALQDQPQGRACGASLCFAERRPLRLSLVRDSRGRLSEGWPGPSAPSSCSRRL
jgi:hypothetical protein